VPRGRKRRPDAPRQRAEPPDGTFQNWMTVALAVILIAVLIAWSSNKAAFSWRPLSSLSGSKFTPLPDDVPPKERPCPILESSIQLIGPYGGCEA
jgi:hypothetical protein